MPGLWRDHRRIVVAGTVAAAMVGLLASTGLTGGHRTVTNTDTPRPHPSLPVGALPVLPAPTGPETTAGSGSIPSGVIAQEEAVPPVPAAASAAYPPAPGADTGDPDGYAQAFATELLAQDYAHTSRVSLLSWVQSEDSPASQTGVPRSVGEKVLVQSLTSPEMSGGTATAVPSASVWATLASEGAFTTVAQVQVKIVPDWESEIMAGHQPADRLMTMRQVTATVTLHMTVSGQPQTTVDSVAFTMALGTAAHHPGYGAMATYGYVDRAVS